ncbi:hypothetical protein GCM10010271_42640 [Streptomyces kurssanovii]|nr:hypothetical protein GCM10010271_42640 [Streptomyces kurssanovii]
MTVGASGVTVASEVDDGGPAGAAGRPEGRRGGPAAWARLWPLVLAGMPLGLLAVAAWFGRHVRPSADEWCFLPVVRDEGISGLLGKFWFTDNGRLGNGLLVGLYAEFPVAGHQWFGFVSGLVMLVLLWALVVQVLRRAGQDVPRGVPLFVAAMVCAVFLFATPNTYKTFYWPAASVSHTVAPVLACAAVLPLLCSRGRAGRITAVVSAALAGMFLGTLSEETSVVALVVLAGVVLFAHRILAAPVRRAARLWSLAGAAGVVVGTLLLFFSPGSRNRRERYGAESASMLSPDSLLGSLRGYAEILGTVFGTWQYLGAVGAGVLLGLVARDRPGRAPVLLRKPLLLGLGTAAFLVAGLLCTVITYPVFGERVVTTERTWNDYLLLLVGLLVVAGAFLGRALRPSVSGRRSAVTVAAAAAVCAATVLSLLGPLADLGRDMQVRAERWDHQDRYLREGAARGAKELPYTPTPVARMLEPFGQQGRKVWPAQCVADYYRLDEVTYSERLP